MQEATIQEGLKNWWRRQREAAAERRAFKRHGVYAILVERGTDKRLWICPNDSCRGAFNPLPGHQFPPSGWECPSCKELREQAELLRQRENEIEHVWEQFVDIDERRRKSALRERADEAMRDTRKREPAGIPPGWHKEVVGLKEELQALYMQAADFDLLKEVKAHLTDVIGLAEKARDAGKRAADEGNRTAQRTREAEYGAFAFIAARLNEIISMDKDAIKVVRESLFDFLETALRMTGGMD